MITIQQAREFREKLQRMIRELPGEKAVMLPAAFAPWKAGSYAVGDVVQLAGQVWECLIAHDSSVNVDWLPGQAPTIWRAYHAKDAAYAKNYVAPTGAHNAYQAGEYMIWTDGVVYCCLTDNTVHSPDALPGAWEAMQPNGGEEDAE